MMWKYCPDVNRATNVSFLTYPYAIPVISHEVPTPMGMVVAFNLTSGRSSVNRTAFDIFAVTCPFTAMYATFLYVTE